MPYQEWTLGVDVEVEVENDAVRVTCTNTVKPKNALTWVSPKPFRTIELSLPDLSGDMQRSLGIPEPPSGD